MHRYVNVTYIGDIEYLCYYEYLLLVLYRQNENESGKSQAPYHI